MRELQTAKMTKQDYKEWLKQFGNKFLYRELRHLLQRKPDDIRAELVRDELEFRAAKERAQ